MLSCRDNTTFPSADQLPVPQERQFPDMYRAINKNVYLPCRVASCDRNRSSNAITKIAFKFCFHVVRSNACPLNVHLYFSELLLLMRGLRDYKTGFLI
jgi:hypothetical protein